MSVGAETQWRAETHHRLSAKQLSMGGILYVHNCLSVPWAEREDGERDQINKPLNNRKMHASQVLPQNRKERVHFKKKKSRDRRVEPEKEQNNKSDLSNTTGWLSLPIYRPSYLHDGRKDKLICSASHKHSLPPWKQRLPQALRTKPTPQQPTTQTKAVAQSHTCTAARSLNS